MMPGDPRKVLAFVLLYPCIAMLVLADGVQAQPPAAKPAFTLAEVMIPMRDGVRLQTVILAPSDQKAPLPILFRRTPYARYLNNSIPHWNDIVAHPDYDEFWKKEAWVRQLHSTTVPTQRLYCSPSLASRVVLPVVP